MVAPIFESPIFSKKKRVGQQEGRSRNNFPVDNFNISKYWNKVDALHKVHLLQLNLKDYLVIAMSNWTMSIIEMQRFIL